jgi:hypothetical protein
MSKAQTTVLVFLMIWYGWFFTKKIDLTTADLGRHIKNGEMVLRGEWGVFETNFYSYTEPEFPTVNHHWGTGVIFYLIQRVFGFTGLSIFYLIISLAVFYLFFWIAQKEAGFNLAVILSVLLVPLMAARTEIRPEGLSYFFMALFFLILQSNKKRWFWVLPLVQLVWVNTHIYFIFGLALVGLFWVKEMISKDSGQARMTMRVLVATGVASFVSPFGLKGVLYPLNILREYGYRIVENQSVSFLVNWGFKEPNLRLFEICIVILIISFVVLFVRNRKKFSFTYLVLAVVWGTLGFMAIRNFAMFAFFSLVIVGYNLKNSRLGVESFSLMASVLVSLFILVNIFYFYYPKLPWGNRFGLGLAEGNQRSVKFFEDYGLKGPVFNNYDLGGYLIYNFYPKWRVFTDNRPEAYSVAHFKDVYIPAQYENGVWQELEGEYGFNVIYFGHRDYTDWGQKFLIERVEDDSWAVVYYDPYVIIFLKRNELNGEVIEKYEVSKQVFGL